MFTSQVFVGETNIKGDQELIDYIALTRNAQIEIRRVRYHTMKLVSRSIIFPSDMDN